MKGHRRDAKDNVYLLISIVRRDENLISSNGKVNDTISCVYLLFIATHVSSSKPYSSVAFLLIHIHPKISILYLYVPLLLFDPPSIPISTLQRLPPISHPAHHQPSARVEEKYGYVPRYSVIEYLHRQTSSSTNSRNPS